MRTEARQGREHGTQACYVWGPGPGPGKGCRCGPCREANRAYERRRARRTAPAYVAAARARAHVEELRDKGVGLKTVAKRSGVSHGALSKLVYGDPATGRGPSKRIRKTTEDAILAVQPSDAADHARVDGAGYRRDVAALLNRGWTRSAIARAIGVDPTNFRAEARTVTARKARAVRALLDQPAPPRRSRWGEHPVPQPDGDEADRARRAAEAERRAAYRAAQRPDPPPGIDPDVFLAPWRRRAACRHVPDDQRWIFWPGRGDTAAAEAAKAVCATCPVRADCLAFALDNDEAGIWGGTTGRERRTMREAAA